MADCPKPPGALPSTDQIPQFITSECVRVCVRGGVGRGGGHTASVKHVCANATVGIVDIGTGGGSLLAPTPSRFLLLRRLSCLRGLGRPSPGCRMHCLQLFPPCVLLSQVPTAVQPLGRTSQTQHNTSPAQLAVSPPRTSTINPPTPPAVTWDDAITSHAYGLIQAIVGGLKQRNGCPVPSTFFITSTSE